MRHSARDRIGGIEEVIPVAHEDLLRCGLLLPRPGEAAPRRILRARWPGFGPPAASPPRAHAWSGERGRELTIPIFAPPAARPFRSPRPRARVLIGYCKRADAWTSDPRLVYG